MVNKMVLKGEKKEKNVLGLLTLCKLYFENNTLNEENICIGLHSRIMDIEY